MPIKDQPKDARTSGCDVGIVEKICERLVNGESLRAICADPAMPARATVFRWLARNQEFRRSYALARQCQAEDLADEILKIADDSSRDYKKKIGADGKVTWVGVGRISPAAASGLRPAKGSWPGWRPESTAAVEPKRRGLCLSRVTHIVASRGC
jgi:hypothetical protein